MPNRGRRDLLLILCALAVLVWGAVLAAYCGLSPDSHAAEAAEGTEYFQVLGLRLKITDALLTVFTGVLAFIAWQQRGHNLTSERAYVKMSHHSPGLDHDPRNGTGLVRIRVENFGRTPATVTDVVLNAVMLPLGETLPAVPQYPKPDRHDPMRAFLVINDSFEFWRRFGVPVQVWTGEENFWLVGYVDYTDAFGRPFRAGYARRYKYERDKDDPSIYPTAEDYEARNNLVLDAPEGYNYDDARSEAEDVPAS